MKKLIHIVAVVAACLCITAAAMAQNAGTATNHAFLLGKGAGNQGYSSLLCTSAQLVVGQAAADPICRTLTGDVTISAGGVTAIGASVVHSSMLNADVFSTAHSWSAIQSFSTLIDLSAIAAPATPASGHGSAWFDSTDLRLHDKNASGTIGTTVVASTCGAHQWDSSLSSAGVRTCTQPGFSDLSGSLATAQLPGLASALIWVGNGSGAATAVSMSADCSLSNTGAITCTKTNGTAFGPFATIASQTSNVIYKGNGAAAPVVSGLTDDGTKVSTSENIDLTSKAAAIEVANAGTTGTTLNMLAKLSGAPSTALITATTDAGGAVGIVVAGAGTTSNAVIAVGGTASCVFDGATVAGDYVQISGTIAGNCHDAGSTYPTSGQVIGRVLSTNGAGGTFPVLINDEIRAASGGGGGISSVTITPGPAISESGACNSSLSITCTVAVDPSFFRGMISGLTMSTAGASTTFSVASGVAVDSTSVAFMKLASAISKTTSAFAAGTGNGCLDTGTIAANTYYHEFLIENTTGPVVDILCSLSATAPTMPGAFTVKRRIGAMKTNASSQWTGFNQFGDYFYWVAAVAESPGAVSTTDVTVTLAGLPAGIRVEPFFHASSATGVSGESSIRARSPDMESNEAGIQLANATASFGMVNNVARIAGSYERLLTNTSGQLTFQVIGGGGLALRTYGWFDARGRYD